MAVAGGVTAGRKLALIAAAGAIALGAWWLARGDEQQLAPRAERGGTRESAESGAAAGDAFDVARRDDEERSAADGTGAIDRRGGRVRGRVVDDLGRPLAGVRVGTDPPKPRADDPAPRYRFVLGMVTGSDGRYEFGVGGALASPREDEISLLFRWEHKIERLETRVADGETVELRDVLFERARTFAGRVVEEGSGAPVAGALVTAQAERAYRLGVRAFDRPWVPRQPAPPPFDEESALDTARAPWEPGFVLSREEAITDADGRFEVVTAQSASTLFLVVAPDWRRRSIPWPQVAPGGRVDGIEVRLAPETQLFLDVTEPGGGPLTSQIGLPPRFRMRTFVTTREGVEVAGQLFDAGATTFAAAFRVAPQAIEKLSLRSDDHRPLDHPVTSTLAGRPTLAFTLERKERHEIRLRVKFASEEDVARLGRLWILVDAVVSPVAARGEPGDDSMASTLFDRKMIEPRLSTDVILSVPARRTWYVVARGPFWNDSSDSRDVDLGAFEPGDELHEVVLPPVSEAWLAAKALPAQGGQPGAAGGPPAKPSKGIVGAIVVDAATKARLGESSIDFHFTETRDGEEHEWLNRGRRRSALGIEWDTVSMPAGDYSLRVSAKGYRPSPPRPITVIADAPVDAGRFELEPSPRWRVKLLATDGTAVPAGWRVVHDIGQGVEESAAIPVEADGFVTLLDELPPTVRLRVFAPSAAPYGSGVPPIDFELAAWPPETTAELRLPPRVPIAIEVDLAAVEADLLELPWTVSAIADGKTRGATQARYTGGELARTSRLRRFDFDLPPGRWRIRSRAALYVADDLVVEIAADGTLAGEATRRVTARPR